MESISNLNDSLLELFGDNMEDGLEQGKIEVVEKVRFTFLPSEAVISDFISCFLYWICR